MASNTKSITAAEILKESDALVSAWTKRNKQFKVWYELITMKDQLKQEGMESFVSNEPRTFFNMSQHLLTPQFILPRIPLDSLEPEQIPAANETESNMADQFRRMEQLSMLRGHSGWMRELVGFLLLTGWYSVLSFAAETEIVCEIWNPAESYPEYDEYGLLGFVHRYPITKAAALRKATVKGWKLQTSLPELVIVNDRWKLDEDGTVLNGTVLGTELVKPLQPEPSMKKIPIYCAPVAGLPDRGAIDSSSDWTQTVGQSAVAVNQNMYEYTNKLFTFYLQMLRDSAQPRWVERSQGEAKVNPADIFKRGAVFHLGLNEELIPLSMPAIPSEFRSILFDMSSMRSKGQLPDQLYANLQQAISGYLMQQISGNATHILRPYLAGIRFLVESLCNDWREDIIELGYKPYELSWPKTKLPKAEIDLRLDIPGDMVQRATVARMLNPDFRLSTQTVTDYFFPEIKDPIKEFSNARTDLAMKHPVMINLELVKALQGQARILETSDPEMSKLYAQSAQQVMNPQGKSTGQVSPLPQQVQEQAQSANQAQQQTEIPAEFL